jgi:hypothetical protein
VSYDKSRVILDFSIIHLILMINNNRWRVAVIPFSPTFFCHLCFSSYALLSFKYTYQDRLCFFLTIHGDTCRLLVFLLPFSSFCCYCYFVSLNWVFETSEKHTSILVCVLCVDRRIFFFDEMKRKEKEIGLSFSLHPLSFSRVVWIIINIIHIIHSREKWRTFFLQNKQARELSVRIIEFWDAIYRLR